MINPDTLREKIRERVESGFDALCDNCGATITSADRQAGYCTQCKAEIDEVDDESVNELKQELTEARVKAIDECSDKLGAMRAVGYNAQFGTMTGVIEGGYVSKSDAVAALQALKGEE